MVLGYGRNIVNIPNLCRELPIHVCPCTATMDRRNYIRLPDLRGIHGTGLLGTVGLLADRQVPQWLSKLCQSSPGIAFSIMRLKRQGG